MQHSHYLLHTCLQTVVVHFILDKQLTVRSIYLPADLNFSTNEIQYLINQHPSQMLLLGDLNTHKPIWGGQPLDAKGQITEDILDNNNIMLSNDSSMTFYDIYSNQLTAIDLSICSADFHLNYA